MRNIRIIQKRQHPRSLLPAGCKSAVYSVGDHGCLYICGGGVLAKFSVEDEQSIVHLCDNRGVLEDVKQIQYVASTGIIYMVNERGSFLQFMQHDNEVEELFQSEQGIASFCVSPDSRCVAIVTKENTLLLLTLPDLETLSQQDLVEGGGGDRGSNNEANDSVKVVWREDSHYFAVNCKHAGNYQVKIFDESGAFHSKTEDANQLLDSTLEWQPSGGLLAAVGTTPHGTVVSLFERNGLKRADFFPYEGKNVTYSEEMVLGLVWNPSSDILAIVYSKKVELWCRNNYVWMRKVTITGSTTPKQNNNKLVFTSWDRERSTRFHLVDDVGNYAVYDVAFTYTSGYSDGSALVASWNGNTIHSTPFKTSCCPPPQCLYQCVCESDVKAAVIPSFWNGLLTVSYTGELVFWRNESSELKQLRNLTVPAFEGFQDSYDWLWPCRSTICCISNGNLITLRLENGDFEDVKNNITLSLKKLTKLNHHVVSAFPSERTKESNTILTQTENGSVFKVDLSIESCTSMCKFPQICTHLHLLSETVVSGHDPLTRKLMLGWSEYPDSEIIIISNDCTSCVTFQDSLIYTTIQGSLEIRNGTYITKFLEKNILGSQFSSEEESQLRYTRKCEKGSTIVTCCLNQMLEPSLVLQMLPRGNLEIIYPRPLVVEAVKVIMREKENNSRYEKIMGALRRHRIDYRVLIDEMRVLVSEEDDCRLESLLKTMVDQVQDSHSLVLLVTDLNQDYFDCILTIKTILEDVITTNANKRMAHVEESYLAAMAKLGLLEEALKSSLVLGENESNRELVQHRVKFLSFYCENPDILFDTALGTYDLSLASLVADCLGKDPKEYIPVLESFQSMLELKRRFKIDDKLRRYNKAVINLTRDQRVMHHEIVKYMERHRLFTDVIEFLSRKLEFDEGGIVERSQDDMGLLLRESQLSYASYLEERGKLAEASILFREGGNVDKAIECCVKSGNWEFGLEIGYENGASEEKIQTIYKSILTHLDEKRMFSDAARLCETYLCDIQQAVYFWIKDRNWQHASALCVKSPTLGKSFRDENIKPKLLDACTEQKEAIHQILEDLENKIQRLRKVKAAKAEKLLETGGIGDNFSDTESFLSGSSTSGSISSSNASGKSFRSGKNKRKLERKVYSLKEGSKYEDLGILVHIWTAVDKIQQELKPDVVNTVESLWRFNQGDWAVSLSDMLEKLLQGSDRIIQEVWSAPVTDEILETKYRIPPVTWTPAWNKLALHERSSKASTR